MENETFNIKHFSGKNKYICASDEKSAKRKYFKFELLRKKYNELMYVKNIYGLYTNHNLPLLSKYILLEKKYYNTDEDIFKDSVRYLRMVILMYFNELLSKYTYGAIYHLLADLNTPGTESASVIITKLVKNKGDKFIKFLSDEWLWCKQVISYKTLRKLQNNSYHHILRLLRMK